MAYVPPLVPRVFSTRSLLGSWLCAAAIIALSHAVLGQARESDQIKIVPNNIEYIPPIARAVLTRDPTLVSKVLLSKESDVNERVRAKEGTRAGFTALILAASLSDVEIAQMLVKQGAKASIFDDFHRSAFWYAALNDNVQVTQVLGGAQGARDAVNAADDDLKRTPLHLAVHGTDPRLVELLVKLGASREEKDALGETPYQFCKRRLTEACSALN